MGNKKFLIGITGLPGCGKTEVLKVFEEEGFFIIEGDKIAHEVFEENREEIEKIFNKKGITRKEVAEIIFENLEKKRRFESFIHPLLLERIFGLIQNINFPYIVVEGTLLFELSTEEKFDLIITVTSDLSSIYERMKKKGFKEDIIKSMINSCFSQDEKIKRADICVDNRGTLSDLKRKVKRLCKMIKR
ncbi:MAG: dephospho-CoA kinase [candidate division WOR-3 bacterium]